MFEYGIKDLDLVYITQPSHQHSSIVGPLLNDVTSSDVILQKHALHTSSFSVWAAGAVCEKYRYGRFGCVVVCRGVSWCVVVCFIVVKRIGRVLWLSC